MPLNSTPLQVMQIQNRFIAKMAKHRLSGFLPRRDLSGSCRPTETMLLSKGFSVYRGIEVLLACSVGYLTYASVLIINYT